QPWSALVARAKRVDMHRVRNVLHVLLASVPEDERHLVAHLLVGRARDANSTGLRDAFQPRRHVHAIPEDVVPVENNVAEVDADAELDSPLSGYRRVSLGHVALDIDGTTHRIHDAAELSQETVSSGFDDATAMLGDLGIDKRAQVVREPGMRALLIHAGQAAVASHVGCQDGGETSLYTFGGQSTPVSGCGRARDTAKP